jgi:hypothetical protein
MGSPVKVPNRQFRDQEECPFRHCSVNKLTGEIWGWDSDYGRNEFLPGSAHTAYAIYSAEGKLLRYVRNAKNHKDPFPTLVTLAPGGYTVEAEAEQDGGGPSKSASRSLSWPGNAR